MQGRAGRTTSTAYDSRPDPDASSTQPPFLLPPSFGHVLDPWPPCLLSAVRVQFTQSRRNPESCQRCPNNTKFQPYEQAGLTALRYGFSASSCRNARYSNSGPGTQSKPPDKFITDEASLSGLFPGHFIHPPGLTRRLMKQDQEGSVHQSLEAASLVREQERWLAHRCCSASGCSGIRRLKSPCLWQRAGPTPDEKYISAPGRRHLGRCRSTTSTPLTPTHQPNRFVHSTPIPRSRFIRTHHAFPALHRRLRPHGSSACHACPFAALDQPQPQRVVQTVQTGAGRTLLRRVFDSIASGHMDQSPQPAGSGRACESGRWIVLAPRVLQ